MIALLLAALSLLQDPEEIKATVAVLKFHVDADRNKFVIKCGDKENPVDAPKAAEALYDHFVTTLIKTGRFDVMESDKVDAILKRRELGDLSDPESVKKAARLLGAQYVFQGSLAMLKAIVSEKAVPNLESYVMRTTEVLVILDLRVLSAETGKVVIAMSRKEPASKSKRISRGGNDAIDGDVNDLIAQAEHQLVKSLVRKALDEVYPIKVVSFQDEVVSLNRGKDGLAVNDDLLVVILGEELRHPDTNAVIGQEETEIALLRVTEVLNRISKAKIVEWKTESKEIPKDAVCRRVEKK